MKILVLGSSGQIEMEKTISTWKFTYPYANCLDSDGDKMTTLKYLIK